MKQRPFRRLLNRWRRFRDGAPDIRPLDTFMVSYPRSGNFWTRAVLTKFLDRERLLTLERIGERVPDLYRPGGVRHFPDPRIIKSHAPADPGYPRVIYILRDGRDALTSYYRFSLLAREFDGPFDRFVRERLTDPRRGFGPWQEHVRGWVLTDSPKPRLILRYEEMWSNPIEEFGRLAAFMGIEVGAAEILAAVQEARAVRSALAGRAAGGLGKGPGSWKTSFTPEIEAFFWQHAGPTMSALGYSRS